ncbi:hypothetical protein [Kitasatospora sp. NPDC094011]|uniref:hypothetical protein n=1 Tax=Kitasatospora sp. NPDC094011 TaxID=3364090 RepID=UPI00381C23C3
MSDTPQSPPTPGPEGEPAVGTSAPTSGPEGDQGARADDQAAALTAAESARAAAEKRAAEAEQEAARLRRTNAASKGTDLDAIKAEIRAEFAAELVRAEVRAAAAGRLRDPADALALVDLAALAGSDGSVNSAAVTSAISKLVESKPYLAADSAEAPKWGDVGAGPRQPAEPEPGSPYDRLRRVQRNN